MSVANRKNTSALNSLSIVVSALIPKLVPGSITATAACSNTKFETGHATIYTAKPTIRNHAACSPPEALSARETLLLGCLRPDAGGASRYALLPS